MYVLEPAFRSPYHELYPKRQEMTAYTIVTAVSQIHLHGRR